MTTWQGEFDKLFIGGEWAIPAGSGRIPVISPASGELVAEVPEASIADADRAVALARDAFDHGPWPRLPLSERVAVLRRFSAAMSENEELLAALITDEMGCPISLSRTMQSRNPRIMVDTFIDIAETYPWSEVRRAGGAQSLVTREPVGVVAAITPWNAPLLTVLIKLIPALLAGCTVVVKPSPEAPLSSYLLAEFLQRAGVPAGVVSIIPSGREVGEHLVSHRSVDKVAFTGSTAAGRRIAGICGADLRRVTLELGGKSAAVILPDADLDLVIDNVRTLSLRNSGQTCSNKTRIIVPRTLRTELDERLLSMIASMPIGDPHDPMTQIGPLVTERQRDVVEGYIDAGRSEGARVLVGGGRPANLDHGWYVAPTIFTEVAPSMRIAQEEIFGPVLAVLTYDDESEAIALANDSDFGLSGSVFSVDEDRALAVAREMRTGAVEVNGRPVGWQSPVGGFKASGMGREAGSEGLDAYIEYKSYGLTPALAESIDG